MKKLFAVLLTVLATHASAWDQRAPLPLDACKPHSPYGFAQTSRPASPICREAYLVAYDAPVKIPAYVAYTLLPQNALGCFPRTNAFVADARSFATASNDSFATSTSTLVDFKSSTSA